MTKKYQRPAAAYSSENALAYQDKYQQDSSRQPRIAISSAKIDGDFNYIIDALNDLNLASGSMETIKDRLNTSLNDDGSLRASATAVLDDWVRMKLPLSFAEKNAFYLYGDVQSLLKKGLKVRLIIQNELLYAYVYTAYFDGEKTKVTVFDAQNSLGEKQDISSAPSSVSYSPVHFNLPKTLDHLSFYDENKNLFTFSYVSGNLKLQKQNSDGSFTEVASVGNTGISLSNESVTESKLATDLADKINAKATGCVGTSAGNIIALDANSKLPAVDGSQLTGISGVSVGAILSFATEAAVPSGYLMCNGATFDASTYPKLYEILGQKNKLPDLRGEFMRGADMGRGVDSGRSVGSWQMDGIKNHSHSYSGKYSPDGQQKNSSNLRIMADGDDGYRTGTFTTANKTSGGIHETRPRNVAFVYAIKAE